MNPSRLLLLLPAAASAFGSVPADRFVPSPPTTDTNVRGDGPGGPGSTSPAPSASDDAGASSSSPWRVVLDVGREPRTRMPSDWARSGCRMPLVIPTDLEEAGGVVPRSDAVSFTGPNGAVVRPLVGNEWELSRDRKTLTLSYTMPEALERRDVRIDAGTELVLTGRVYAQEEMDVLNAELRDAREDLWKAGGEIGDVYDRKNASKRWDEASGRWVRRYEDDNPLDVARKRMAYWGAKAVERRRMARRPRLEDLSDRGTLPGVEGGVYVANKGGVVRAGRYGPVVGTWSATPITDAPASYRS